MTSILDVFKSLSADLEQLSALAQQKIDAVKRDDLADLNEVLKQEQVISLSIRGLERKLTELLEKFKLQNVKLIDLPKHFPPEHQVNAAKTVDELRAQYQLYAASSQASRNTMEINLHQIEKILAASGADNITGPGYASPEPNIPSQMKTDFRA